RFPNRMGRGPEGIRPMKYDDIKWPVVDSTMLGAARSYFEQTFRPNNVAQHWNAAAEQYSVEMVQRLWETFLMGWYSKMVDDLVKEIKCTTAQQNG
ncbi:hypothetical protein, partial [Enterococcus faecium]